MHTLYELSHISHLAFVDMHSEVINATHTTNISPSLVVSPRISVIPLLLLFCLVCLAVSNGGAYDSAELHRARSV